MKTKSCLAEWLRRSTGAVRLPPGKVRCAPGTFALVLAIASGPAIAAVGDADLQAFREAEVRARDAETMRTLVAEGRLLLARDSVRLDGYAYCSMSVAAAERGDFRTSIESAARALVVAQETDNDNLVALSKRDLAIAYSYAGDLDDARRYALEALAGKPRDTAQVFAPAHKVLGDIALREGDPQAAIASYREALDTASARYTPFVMASLASAQIAAGDAAAARTSLAHSGGPPEPPFVPFFHRIEGNLLLAEGDAQHALAAFSAGLAAAPRDTASDTSYDNLWAHEGMARAYQALGESTRARAALLAAIADSENMRARFRSDEFKTGLFADVQSVFDRAIGLAVDDGDYAEAWRLSERSRARALLDTVRNRVEAGVDPRQLNGQPVTLDTLRAALRSDEAMVEFHSLENRLIVFVVRRDGLVAQALPIRRRDMDSAVDDLRTAIIRRQPTAIAFGTRLDTLLIAPLGLRPNERLVVVPHGALHYMPFQALHDAEGFLIQRHAIAIAPSAGVALQLMQRSRHVASELVAFGNPRITPAYDLPGAEREVRGIAPLFARRSMYLEGDVTRVRFNDNAPAGRVLHVATHAEADTIDPLHSRILLAPARQPADGPDPLLARDIYNLKLDDVALVTLSACETGLGRIARGDEILGFTRAFFYAGASSMIASMWPVSDESTVLTMRTFYRALTDGAEAIDAMRSAQLAVLNTPGFAQPFYWAPFELIGGWRLTVAR